MSGHEKQRSCRVLLAMTQTLEELSLRLLLGQRGHWEVVEGKNRDPFAQDQRPDLVIADVDRASECGARLIRELVEQYPSTPILALSRASSDEILTNCLAAGARGFLPKSASSAELQEAMHVLVNGSCYLAPEVCPLLIQGYVQGMTSTQSKVRDHGLTPREHEVLRLVLERHTTRAIAEQLFISIKTVEKHRSNIMRKLGVRNATELLTAARDLL